jgi:hypothetical protein
VTCGKRSTQQRSNKMTETKKLTKDRNYYRMMSDAELVAYAKRNTALTELEVVLAERLKEARGLHHI